MLGMGRAPYAEHEEGAVCWAWGGRRILGMGRAPYAGHGEGAVCWAWSLYCRALRARAVHG